MEVDTSIFRAYDIRGVYGKTIDESIMKKIGMAVGTMMKKRNMGSDILVGNDIRESSPRLSKAFIEGVTSVGINVTDVGTSSFGLAIFSGWRLGKDVTAFITASHNPPEWNGIKFFDKDCVGFFKEDNEEIGKIVRDEYFETKAPETGRGTVKTADLKQDYINELKKSFKFGKKIRVVIDCGNGSSATVVPEVFESIGGIEVEIIFDRIDPSFPDRGADVEKANLEKLAKVVSEKNADIGIGFDGDGDRLGVVDDKGRYVKSEKVMSILSKELLGKNKGAVVVNVEASMIIEKTLRPAGASIIRIPVGHTFMGQSVNENMAIFGGEPSCHYVMPQYFPFDDAVVPALKLIEIISNGSQRLSDMSDSIHEYPTERISEHCDDSIKFKVIENLKRMYSEKFENMNTLDGIRIEFEDGWILIRASNTGPAIRLTIEAADESELERLKGEFLTDLKLEIDKVKAVW